MNLDGSKATPAGDIPTDMLKQAIDTCLPIISIDNDCCSDDLKFAEVCRVFLKKDDLDKEIYRPASVLSHVSKVSERIKHR